MTLRARIERLLSPGLGWCYRCERPWKSPARKYLGVIDGVSTWRQLPRLRWWGLVGVESHVTDYSEGTGCFPLCEGCWAALTPTERLPFYDRLYANWYGDRWPTDPPLPEYTLIVRAVLEGK